MGLLRDCDTSLSDEEVLEDIDSKFPNAKVERFKKKDDTILPLVKVTFESEEHLKKAIDEGIAVGNIYCNVEKFIFRNRPILCYNCYKYGHVAKWCSNKTVCGNCSKKHATAISQSEKTTCCNCKGTHEAWSKNCPEYEKECDRVNKDVALSFSHGE